MTVVEHIEAAIEDLRSVQASAASGEAKREFALAITAFEEARMRTNRGYAHVAGLFREVDVQKQAGL